MLKDNVLIYDGDCPVCANYVAFAKVRRKIVGLRLVSARSDDPVVREAWKQGIDLNDEMALYVDGRWIRGADAILELARLGEPNIVDRFMYGLLGRASGRKFRYGFLVGLRKLLLKILGRSEISPFREP